MLKAAAVFFAASRERAVSVFGLSVSHIHTSTTQGPFDKYHCNSRGGKKPHFHLTQLRGERGRIVRLFFHIYSQTGGSPAFFACVWGFLLRRQWGKGVEFGRGDLGLSEGEERSLFRGEKVEGQGP